ncbi:hypothetical protein AURDEDRAFT_110837 [Auricularia subglabra TFB-10046 SS5]|nr:hypothetical protein AURDEDRAFT_110837 [Auricularia subglabra TFB-10046 SS5]
MVKLSVVPTRGNAGGRFFPSTGFLALTPVKVEGIIRTRLDADGRPLQCKSIDVAVRCYEARVGRVGIQHTNVLAEYVQTLWSKPVDRDCEDVGDKDLPFKIVVPQRTKGPSTQNFQTYRVYWRVEATFNHLPMTGFGTRQVKGFELLLIRHDAPKRRTPARPPSYSTVRGPRSLSLQHLVSLPQTAAGPLDIIPVSVRLKPLGDENAKVSSLSLSVQRRISISEAASAVDDPLLRSSQASSPRSADRHRDSLSLLSSASDVALLGSLQERSSSAPQSSSSSSASPKHASLVIANVEATSIPKDDTDHFAKTLYVSLPTAKSNNHWALGETLSTPLASVSFFVLIKVSVLLSNGQHEQIDLPPQELLMSATNAAERQSVLSKYPDLFDKRRRSEHSPARDPPKSAGDPASPAVASSANAVIPKPRKSRRPHTASGESPQHPSSAPSARRKEEPAPPPPPPPPAASRAPIPLTISTQASHASSTASLVLPLTPRSGTASTTSVDVPPCAADVDVLAWEAELERIEHRSRQLSASFVPPRKPQKLDPAPIAVAAT